MTIQGFTVISGSNDPCNTCLEHIGDYFENAKDLPKVPFHPNCKCYYEADIREDISKEELMDIANGIIKKTATIEEHGQKMKIEVNELRQLNDVMNQVFSYIDSDLSVNWSQAFSDAKENWLKYGGIWEALVSGYYFMNEFKEMYLANTKGGDNIYHSLANAQAAQKGAIGVKTSKLISSIREARDIINHIEKLKNEHDLTMVKIKALIMDVIKDLRNNQNGRNLGEKQGESKLSRSKLREVIMNLDKFTTSESKQYLSDFENKNIFKKITDRWF